MPVMEEALKASHPPIRSFVLRQGRITAAQTRAVAEHLSAWQMDAHAVWQDPWKGQRPLLLEIGFGNGEHLAAIARQRPDWGCIGAEVHTPGVGSLLLQLLETRTDNVRIIHDDVVTWLQTLPEALLQCIIIQFPDPWPKKRQQKRRLIQPDFAALLCRLLVPGGELQMATDWADYAEQMLAVLNATPGLQNTQPGAGYAPRPDNRILTRFERRGQRLGHAVYDLGYQRLP
ncbi:tRNA (guanine-N(7)-)-methyltransferase [Acidithiobacillus ferrivorans SS3]|uniref:tRNA (guanine-N(7)-)-methyltransferase n=1 Tax=Acidithiobacillus ferrivorans SS3 TaxID=743299 RepID=G0JRY1_9PROT|nr:tRNA (guanosine(46)-N7)-methyltransferase TrmB [Acidithiobacillus ferrivorans]AEM48835.1 tRNA (guanine-N(7)-)-methyltransferase [Acidithiobacillus ferrivorans SS3]